MRNKVGLGDKSKKEKGRCGKGGSRPEKGKRLTKHLHICPPSLPCLLLKLQIGKPVKQFNHDTAATPAKRADCV